MDRCKNLLIGASLACWFAGAGLAQSPQNPSPMVEHTRSHQRLEQSEPAGLRYDMPLGELFVPQKLQDQKHLPLILHFHGSKWLPEVAVSRWGRGAVISIQLGTGSAVYSKPFAEDKKLFDRLLDQANQRSGKTFGPIILSGWSAG